MTPNSSFKMTQSTRNKMTKLLLSYYNDEISSHLIMILNSRMIGF